MKRLISVLLCVLLLCGCGEKKPQEPAVTESLVWEETPQLNHGVLEYEKLTVQPWYCGRLEFTGGTDWAETELGYYYFDSSSELLYYADKADLSNWVPVCGKPECLHLQINRSCNARAGLNGFLIRDGRIFFPTTSGGKNEPTYVPDQNGVPIICSRAPDGSDFRIEYIFEEASSPSGGGGLSSMFTAEHWLMIASIFNTDGSYTHRCYRISDDGVEIFAEAVDEDTGGVLHSRVVHEGIVVDGMFANTYAGDTVFLNQLVSEVRGDGTFSSYRYRNGEIEKVDNEGYERTGRYLAGNTLRLFRQNEGYYDLDLTTREETFVSAPQLEDSYTTVMLPNCILESNKDKMMFFDGETWREIFEPEELKEVSMYLAGVASDRLLFLCNVGSWESPDVYLYQVMLDREELALEYCGQIL